MSDTTDDMEAGASQYESYLEAQEEQTILAEEREEEQKRFSSFLKSEQKECICNKGVHDGKKIDCGCKLCH